MTSRKLDEREIIRIFSSTFGIRELDDVATVRFGKKQLVFKADMLVGLTDVPPQMRPWQAARKSIVSVVSDLSAKGARPIACMISLGLPRQVTKEYVDDLAKGFKVAANEFGVRIVGGDTNEATDLVIDCSMIGIVDRMPTRAGSRPGDVVAVSGKFGLAASGLAILMKDAQAEPAFRKSAVSSVIEPVPRQKFGSLAKYFSSSIDSSDGLAISLYELASQGGVDIQIDYDAVKAQGVEEFARQNNLSAQDLVFYGGEEYEIVCTIPKPNLARAKLAAKKAGLDLYVIGGVTKGTGNVFVSDRKLENRGYLHFG